MGSRGRAATNGARSLTRRLRARFEPGQERDYELIRVRLRKRAERTRETRSWLRFKVSVVAADRRGATLEWQHLDAQADGGDDPAADAARAAAGPLLLELMRRLRLRYRVRPDGRFLRLLNRDEVGRHVERMRDLLSAQLPEEVRAAVRAATEPLAASDAALLRDVSLFHAPYGLACVEGGQRLQEVRVRHPLGGVVPGVERVRLRTRQGRRGPLYHVVRVERLLDPEPLRRVVLRNLKRMAAVIGRELPTEGVRIELLDRSAYELGADDGWPRRLTFDRDSTLETPLESGSQGETIEIRRAR